MSDSSYGGETVGQVVLNAVQAKVLTIEVLPASNGNLKRFTPSETVCEALLPPAAKSVSPRQAISGEEGGAYCRL